MLAIVSLLAIMVLQLPPKFDSNPTSMYCFWFFLGGQVVGASKGVLSPNVGESSKMGGMGLGGVWEGEEEGGP